MSYIKQQKTNNNNRPPKMRDNKVNEQVAGTVNEFNSYYSRSTYSKYSYGFNIIDFYSDQELQSMVKDPMGNIERLRELSLQLYSSNGVYANTVDYLTALHTLDRVIVAHGKREKKNSANKELMDSTLSAIRDREFIRDALFKGMVEGTAYYYFETTSKPTVLSKSMGDYEISTITEINELGVNASILSLPFEYTRIVGTKNGSYVIAFNLDYFNNFNGDIEQKLKKYPREIREAYVKRTKSKDVGNWVVLNNDNTITHKIKAKRDEPYGRPLVLPAIDDILYRNAFVQTKRNILDDLNNRIIYETFPEGKDKGTSALTKNQQESQHKAVKSAVVNKNNRGGISFFSVAAGTKINQITCENSDIFDEKYESNISDDIALGLGIAASLLNGVGSGTYASQQTNLELISAQLFQWVDDISNELNKCISANIIKDKRNTVECHYLPITYVNRGAMVGYMEKLYTNAGGSMSAYIAACGISPEVYYALLDQELDDGIYEKYKPHQTSYTLSSNDNGGRPETDNPTENTIASRANNGNSLPSPSDNK